MRYCRNMTTCSVPSCPKAATVTVEWGHGHAVGGGPFRDELCEDHAEVLLRRPGPRRVDDRAKPPVVRQDHVVPGGLF